MPYEMRHVQEYVREAKRQNEKIRQAVREIERLRTRLGNDFMNEQRFRTAAGEAKQQVSEINRTLSKLDSALNDIERLSR